MYFFILRKYIFESLVLLDFYFHSLSAFRGKDNLSWYSRTCCFLINESQRCSGHWHCHIGCSCRWWSDETNCGIYSACQRCSRYHVAVAELQEPLSWGHVHVVHLIFMEIWGLYLFYRLGSKTVELFPHRHN